DPRGRSRRVRGEPWHHVAGEQPHRTLPHRWLVPVVAAHQERAEVARLVAQGDELIQDSARAPRDDEGALDDVHGDVLVGYLEVRLQHEERLAPVREAVVEEAVAEGQPGPPGRK